VSYLRARLRAHRTTERGFTLVELGVGIILTVILLGIVLTVMSTFFHVETGNDSTYAELNQLIPVGTAFQQLLRTAVAPGTGGTGKPPVPPFGAYSATSPYALTPAARISHTSLTFFSNTGTHNGPQKVVAALTTKTGAPPTATTCTTKNSQDLGCTFTVRTYAPNPGTCPGLTTATTITPSTPHAHMPRPATDRCIWSTKGKIVLQVNNVDNTVLGKSVFKYFLIAPFNTDFPATPATASASTPTAAFATCTPPTTTPAGGTVTHCPANNIQSVKVDLEVKTPGTKGKIESQTVTYQLSTVSKTYSPEVG
jgi:type II secretory pathway pseudopilin PulG